MNDDPEVGVAAGKQPWSIEDYTVALESWLIGYFVDAGEKIFKVL